MEVTYEGLREFAGSWGLVGMLVFFLGAVVMVLLPGARERADDAAQIPFREE